MKLKNIILTIALVVVGLFCIGYACGKFSGYKSRFISSHSNKNEFRESEKLRGIDLSHHNSGINWSDIDVDFVYLKATEGATHTDNKFRQYRDSCLVHNIPVGAYHFFTTTRSGKDQFKNFKNTVGHSTNLIPVIDIEVNRRNWSRKKLQTEIKDFIKLCRTEYGVAPMIYTSDWFYTRYLKFSEIDNLYLWLGDVKVKRSKLINPHIMHQYAIKRIKGIDNPVDCNALYVPISRISMKHP